MALLTGIVSSLFLYALASIFVNAALVMGASSSSPSWEQYVRAPATRNVLPASVISSYTLGNVTNPNGLLVAGGDVTTFQRLPPVSPPLWPNGTVATASSFHASNVNNGISRTYNPSNAIDGDTTTFWNDDTQGVYPDVLTIISPSTISLPGITIVSISDGVPVDVEVEALINGVWSLVGNITGNANVQFSVPFNRVKATGVRITVTADQDTGFGEFTRIAEVYPDLISTPTIPTVVVDFGQNIVGTLSINFAGASANNPGIRLAFSETLQFLTDVSDFTRSDNGDTITSGTDDIAVSSEPYTWVDNHGCEFNTAVCADGLHGFRYLKIYLDALAADSPYAAPYGSVSIDAISLNFTAFLGTPDTFAGWFECSDTALSQFWYDAAYTNEMTTDTFLPNSTEPRNAYSPTLDGKQVLFDGAKRDRDPYVGDLSVSARTLYLTHNDAIAAKNVLVDLAIHQRSDGWIPPASINDYTLTLYDYPLWWVVCSYDLLMYTGDNGYATTYYQTLLNVLDTYYPASTDPATGLLNKNLGGAAGYGDYAFLPRKGTITYYNALYVHALQNAAVIANYLGHTSDAARWTARAGTVSNATNHYLWDSTTGAYLDSVNSTTHGQDGNSIAIIAGIADAARANSSLNYWSTLALPYGNPFFDNDDLGAGFSKRVYAFLSYFELEARFLSGQGDSAIAEIKRLYGWMSTNDPFLTFWEGIGESGQMYEGGFTSAAHGWSTGVLPALSNYILGVKPTMPGFSQWTIKPIPAGGVTWANGQVPTPSGPIVVSWTLKQTGYSFYMTLNIPALTRGVISVPVSTRLDVVTIDGVPLVNASQTPGYVNFAYGVSGNHTITVTSAAQV